MTLLNLHTQAGAAGKKPLQTASHESNWSAETYEKQVVQGAGPHFLSVLSAADPASPLADLCISSSAGISCFIISEGIGLEYRIC